MMSKLFGLFAAAAAFEMQSEFYGLGAERRKGCTYHDPKRSKILKARKLERQNKRKARASRK